jgi:spheroidene monooxygenase
MSDVDAPTATLSGVVVVLLVDFLRQHRAWGWMRMVQGPSALKNTPGLLFAKVMGSGHDGGFGLRPSASHQGWVCLFDTHAHARAFLAGPHVMAYRERAREYWTGLMAVGSSRGLWDGQAWEASPAWEVDAATPGAVTATQRPAPVLATLTRASIRAASAMSFWRHAPAAQDSLGQAQGCLLAMGLGEAPLVRQCTFSLWRDEKSMHDYARQGAHQQAIQAAYKHNFFTESMFVRLRVLELQGVWLGLAYGNPAAYPTPESAHV